jgi:hypothetical protein
MESARSRNAGPSRSTALNLLRTCQRRPSQPHRATAPRAAVGPRACMAGRRMAKLTQTTTGEAPAVVLPVVCRFAWRDATCLHLFCVRVLHHLSLDAGLAATTRPVGRQRRVRRSVRRGGYCLLEEAPNEGARAERLAPGQVGAENAPRRRVALRCNCLCGAHGACGSSWAAGVPCRRMHSMGYRGRLQACSMSGIRLRVDTTRAGVNRAHGWVGPTHAAERCKSNHINVNRLKWSKCGCWRAGERAGAGGGWAGGRVGGG